MTYLLGALGGIALGLALAFWGRAWVAERLVVHFLRKDRVIPWVLHTPDTFAKLLRKAAPRTAAALGPRAIERILTGLKADRQLQVDLYRDPPTDDAQVVQFLERAGLLRTLELTPEEAHSALDAMDADQRCLTPRNASAEYHPVETPKGAFRLVAEIDPLAGALLTWPIPFPGSWKHHAEFTRHVATGGTALLAVPSAPWQKAVQLYLEQTGVSLENVVFLRIAANDVWVRDYGPSFVTSKQGDTAVIANPYVPWECPFQKADDQFPIELARQVGIPVYRLPLVLEGGNIVTDGCGTLVMCDSVLHHNPEISQARLRELMEAYFGCRQLILLPSLPGEITGHVDMIVKFLDAETVAVASAAPGYRWYDTFEAIADRLSKVQAEGGRTRFRVVRVPVVHTRKSDPRAWSHINALTVNRTVILPRYDLPSDAVAEQIFAEHLPDRNIVSVDMREHLVGAVHCQAKEVPAALSVRTNHD